MIFKLSMGLLLLLLRLSGLDLSAPKDECRRPDVTAAVLGSGCCACVRVREKLWQ